MTRGKEDSIVSSTFRFSFKCDLKNVDRLKKNIFLKF